MPTQSALTLTELVTEESQHAGTPAPERALVFREQAALVRALVEEVECHHPEESCVVPLRRQLGDELLRLARLIDGASKEGEGEGEAAGRERPIDVLVVDDDDDALRALAGALRSLGYPCRTARDGEAALREFDREPAAIVLSDWSMPGMSGLELCVALKRRERRPYLILATTFFDNARLLDGMRGGADDFLRKPLDLDELEVRLLSASSLLRALDAVDSVRKRLSSTAI